MTEERKWEKVLPVIVSEQHEPFVFLLLLAEFARKRPGFSGALTRSFGFEGIGIESFLPVYLVLWGMCLLMISTFESHQR